MKNKVFFLIILFFIVFNAVAQNETPDNITCGPLIGNGSGTSYTIPFNTDYDYSYSQQIYSANELGVSAGAINSLSFCYCHATPITMSHITVYMANISNNTFASNNSWIPASDLIQVFCGSLICSNSDSNLVTIEFDEAFEWDGHSNIVVAILNNQGSSYNSDTRFNTHVTTGKKALFTYRYASAYDIANPGSGTLSYLRNHMRFCFNPAPSCYKPTHLEISNITEEGATLNWQAFSSNDSLWEVTVVPLDSGININTPIFPINNTTYTLTGLNEDMAYDVYVRTVCSATDHSDWVKVSFKTTCFSIQEDLPYIENFILYGTGTDAFPYCWQRSSNHASVNYPYISDINDSCGELLFYSNDRTYSLAVSRALNLSAHPAGSLILTFWIANMYLSDGRMDVGIMTDPNDLNSFSLLKSYYPTDFIETTVFQEEKIVLPGHYQDTVYLAFLAPASGNSYHSSALISRVKLDYAPSCSAPSNLIVSHVEGTSAIIHWDEAIVGANNYTLLFGETGQIPTTIIVSGNEYMLTGLNPGTTYELMLFSNCSEGHADTLTSYFNTRMYVECIQADTVAPAISGTTHTTDYHLPINNDKQYCYIQQIYTPDEININHTPSVITAIAFDYAYTQPNASKNNVKLYLAHRSTNSFANTTDYTPLNEATLVYEGDLICSQGWNIFNFDNYFNYNGHDNLVLIVVDNSGWYDGPEYVFNAHTLDRYASLFYTAYGSSGGSVNTNPHNGVRSYNRSDVKFFGCAQTIPIPCPGPYVHVNHTDSNSIAIEWLANGSENEWVLEYKAEEANSWTSIGRVYLSPYTIQNLPSDVHYDIRLKAVCSDNDSSEWIYTSAYTPCVSMELPIVEDFENYSSNEVPACWLRHFNYEAAPYYSSLQAHSGSNSLYFDCSFYGRYAYAITPKLDEGIAMDSLQIMFYAYTSTARDFIEVGIMSNPDDLSSFTSLGQFSTSSSNTWESAKILSRGYTGHGRYVAFRVPQWNTANSIFIDDINIQYYTPCMHIDSIYAYNITPTTADISWNAGDSESQWNYLVGPAGTVDPNNSNPILVNSNTISLTGLTANTLYDVYIRAYCGAGEQSAWMYSTFRTECEAISILPYEENFDSYSGTTSTSTNILPDCWTRIYEGTSNPGLPTIYNSPSYANSGNNSLYFQCSLHTYVDQYAILPQIDTTAIPINSLKLSFKARSVTITEPFNIQIGVMKDPSDPATFQLIQSIICYETTYINQEVFFNNFSGYGNFIAFKVEYPTSSNNNYGYVDDIYLEEIPYCLPVQNLNVSHIAGASALLSWDEDFVGTANFYSIEYAETGQDNGFFVSNISGTSFMLDQLEPNTNYEVHIQANCNNNSVSDWSTVSFTTGCLAGGVTPIGNGNSTNNIIPSYSSYNYGYSQQIFTAAEIGSAGDLSSLSIDMSNVTQSRRYRIYLMHTTATTLSTWQPTNNAQLVFDNEQVLVQGWNTFHFSAPFTYNGIDNLLLIFIDITNNHTSFLSYDLNSFYVHNATSNCARYIYSNDTPYSINTIPTSGTQGNLSIRNNVIFGGICDNTVNCYMPNIYIDHISDTSADVIWASGYDENAWELEYALFGDSVWTPVINPTGGIVTLNQLSPYTNYQIRMRAVCSSDQKSEWALTDFTTECAKLSIPFSEDFNSCNIATGSLSTQFPDCWTKYDGFSTIYPFVTHYNNYGTTGNFLAFCSTPSTYNIAVMPESAIDVNLLEVSFYMRTNKLSNGMIVGIMTDAYDFDGFVPVDTFFCTTTNTFEYMIVGLDSYLGTGKYIAFKNCNSTSGRLYMDDVKVTMIPSCRCPLHIVVTDIYKDSAVIAWTERGSATEWIIEYGPSGFTLGTGTTIQATQNPYTLTGLYAGTGYDVYVRSNCGGGDLSEWGANHVSFGTYNCTPAHQCEYSFICVDSYGDGWNNAYVCIQQNGVQIANAKNTSNAPQNPTPTIDTVGVMLCDLINTTIIWHSGNYDSEASLIILKPNGDTLYTHTNMSNIGSDTLLNFITNCDGFIPYVCEMPMYVTVDSVSQNGADISWTTGYVETKWNLQYREASATSWGESIPLTSPHYHISGLMAETEYRVRVQANCIDTLSEWTNPISFSTQSSDDDSVSVANTILAHSISLRPNPADQYIELSINSPIEVKEALVFNVFGQLIQAVPLTDNHARIDLSRMAAGMYFVRISNTGATKRFIKR